MPCSGHPSLPLWVGESAPDLYAEEETPTYPLLASAGNCITQIRIQNAHAIEVECAAHRKGID